MLGFTEVDIFADGVSREGEKEGERQRKKKEQRKGRR